MGGQKLHHIAFGRGVVECREELERDRHAARDDFAKIEFVALVGAAQPSRCWIR
jgi:hypothetical protein